MLKICLAFWKSEPQYANKRYAYKKMYVKCTKDLKERSLRYLKTGVPLYP